MKKNNIKSFITIAIFIMLISMVSYAAAPSAESGSLSGGSRLSGGNDGDLYSNIDESKELPSLDLLNQILKDENIIIDKEKYQEASSLIRANIDIINNKIKFYTDYKDIVSEKIKKIKKNEGLDGMEEENKVKAKELIKSLPQEAKKEKTVMANESVDTLTKNEEYYKALEKLNNTLQDKQRQLYEIEKTIHIWQQIDALIK